MSIVSGTKLSGSQINYLNQIQNQYPGLLESALTALKVNAPHLFTGGPIQAIGGGSFSAKPKPTPPIARVFSPMGALGTTTNIFSTGSNLLTGGSNFNLTPSPPTPSAPASAPASSSGSSSLWSSLSTVLTAAIPAYILSSNKTATPATVTTAQTKSLLSSFGIGGGITTLVLVGGAIALAVMLLKKKKKAS